MITQIEQAVLAFFQAASDEQRLPFKWGTLTTYPDNWDEQLKQATTIRAPALWVGFTSWDAPKEEDHRQRVKCRFVIVVMSENQRGEEATRHGDPVSPTTKPGSYSLLETTAAMIAGQTLGIDVDAVRIGRSFQVRPPAALAQRKVSFQAFEVSTSFALVDVAAAITGDAPYETAHANWDIPLLGSVGTGGLPDDAFADATDNIQLEQAL